MDFNDVVEGGSDSYFGQSFYCLVTISDVPRNYNNSVITWLRPRMEWRPEIRNLLKLNLKDNVYRLSKD